MTTRIEFIELKGRNFKIDIFPDKVKNLVATFEKARDEYAGASIKAAALANYVQQLEAAIEQEASQAVQEMLGGTPTTAEETPAEMVDGEVVPE